MRRNHTFLGILTTAALCSTMLPLSASAGEKFQLNGGGQRKGVSDGYSYELWIDNTGGNGSMTLGNGGTFEAVWNCSVPQGNYLARRGMDFAKDNKNALSYGNIQLDYDATYTASSAGNSRLCVYGWFAENTAPQVSGTVVEYYIIEDWVNWCPKPDGQSKTVKIDGADYEIFRIKHTGPTIRNGGGSETFWQYFSIRKSKRTSGTISVSEHFQAWKDAGFEMYNLYEVALNAEGWESSGSANVTKLEMSVGGDPKPTEAPKPTEPPTEPKDGIYMKEDFSNGAGDWTARGSGGVKVTPSDGALNVTGRSDNWHGAAIALDSSTYIPGNAYSFSVMGKAASDDTLKLTLQYNAGGTENYDNVAEITAPAGQWVQLANDSFTIPAGASDMILYVEAESKTNDFSIDDATIASKGTKIAPSSSGSGKTDPTQPGGGEKGDVNNDKSVGVSDLVSLVKHLHGKQSNITSANADLNGDGVIDVFDLGLLKRMILKNGGKDVKAETPTEPVTEKPTEAQGAHLSMKEFTAACQAKMKDSEPNDSHSEKPGTQYGTIKQGSYFSSTCNREKPYNILLPAGYDESKKYPVLYCMHGYYENQDRMIIKGNNPMYTRQIIGNAIASGEAKDMIVVFPYIYSSATQKDCTGMDAANNAAYDNFINDLTKDLMPHIEKTYSVKTGKDNTAITGFSMGGRESLAIGLGLSDKFGYVGAICPAPGVDDAYKGGWKFESGKEPYLIMITAGGNDTIVYDTPKPYHENLEKNGVPHIWHYYQQGYHGDNSIHAHLYNFCRFVFQN